MQKANKNKSWCDAGPEAVRTATGRPPSASDIYSIQMYIYYMYMYIQNIIYIYISMTTILSHSLSLCVSVYIRTRPTRVGVGGVQAGNGRSR
jgi:hypothetical protein